MSKVFVVDDDKTILMLYGLILEELGFKVVDIAENGKDAVEKYKNLLEKPDIVLMDHRMPLMNGIDAMNEIQQSDKNVKFVFLSADTTIREKAIFYGAKAFISKPFDIQKLKITLDQLIKT